MDRLLRLGGGMPGLSQGPPPSDAPVVDTAEQVWFMEMFVFSYFLFSFYCLFLSFLFLTGVYIIIGSLENA